jgi:hypothetical protein
MDTIPEIEPASAPADRGIIVLLWTMMIGGLKAGLL